MWQRNRNQAVLWPCQLFMTGSWIIKSLKTVYSKLIAHVRTHAHLPVAGLEDDGSAVDLELGRPSLGCPGSIFLHILQDPNRCIERQTFTPTPPSGPPSTALHSSARCDVIDEEPSVLVFALYLDGCSWYLANPCIIYLSADYFVIRAFCSCLSSSVSEVRQGCKCCLKTTFTSLANSGQLKFLKTTKVCHCLWVKSNFTDSQGFRICTCVWFMLLQPVLQEDNIKIIIIKKIPELETQSYTCRFRLLARSFLPHAVGLLGVCCLCVPTLAPVCEHPVTPLPSVPQQTNRIGGHRFWRVHNPINILNKAAEVMTPRSHTNLTGFLFCFLEPWAADHEEVGPLQHRPSAVLLLLQWRQGQWPRSAAATLNLSV